MRYKAENSQTLFLTFSFLTCMTDGHDRGRSYQEERYKSFIVHLSYIRSSPWIALSLDVLLLYTPVTRHCCQAPSVDVHSSSVESDCEEVI